MNRTRITFGLALAAALTLVAGPAQSACEVCAYRLFTGRLANNAYCRVAGPNEVGSTLCTLTYDPLTPSIDCENNGIACTVITVEGGGGAGSGGSGSGGSGCTTTTGSCPASCFSCTGGGAPRI